ncbi:hypothetical protein Clacol_005021 [Clathrus columnatus]|uniref:Uncharacterized protein n=1 Tax=Clathrus columnatus TaxID=1419009 RepID=A0AAV5ACC0_9AGAM|nr:hypothetical protein Clacol_005021 [Clathrus columnatus]
MQSFMKLSLLFYFLTLNQYAASQQTITSMIYFPSNEVAPEPGIFLVGKVLGDADGTTTYEIALGTTNTTLANMFPATPTLTLLESTNTARIFGAYDVDKQGGSINLTIDCDVTGDVSNCNELDSIFVSGTLLSTNTFQYTESFNDKIAITLTVGVPSSATLAPSPSPPPSGGGGGGDSPSNSSTPAPGGASPPASSPTATQRNSADYDAILVLLCAFPIVALSIIMTPNDDGECSMNNYPSNAKDTDQSIRYNTAHGHLQIANQTDRARFPLGAIDTFAQQTITSLYFPSGEVSPVPGLVIFGKVLSDANGTTSYELAVGSTDTITLVEATNTARLFGQYGLDKRGTELNVSIDCDVTGNVANCNELDSILVQGASISTDTVAYTEAFNNKVPVTLVNSLPPTTPTSPPLPVSSGGGDSLSNSSSSRPSGGAPPTSPGPSPTATQQAYSQQTITSVYFPTVQTSPQPGLFLNGKVLGDANGTTTYELALGSTNTTSNLISLLTPDTVTLLEATNTARLSGQYDRGDSGGAVGVNLMVDCTVTGNVSDCHELDSVLVNGTLQSTESFHFTEDFGVKFPVTLVTNLPSTTTTTTPTSISHSPSSTTSTSPSGGAPATPPGSSPTANVSPESITSVYIPTVINTPGQVVNGLIVNSENTTTTWELFVGPTTTTDPTLTLTLIEAVSTAHLFNEGLVDSGLTVTNDIQCTINGLSFCTISEAVFQGTTTLSSLSLTTSEFSNLLTVTLITTPPSPQATATSSSSPDSGPSPSPFPVPVSAPSPSISKSRSSSAPVSSPTTTPSVNSANYLTISALLCAALPIITLLIQSTTSLYVPGVSDSDGASDGGSVVGSIVGSQSGTTTWALVLIQNNSSAAGFIPATPTLTFLQASATAHVFGTFQLDEETNGSIDVQCSINGDVADCTETDAQLHGTSTFTTRAETFSESPTPIAITVVSTLPPPTPAPSPSGDASTPTPTPSQTPSSSPSPTSTSPGSSTTNTPNSDNA